MKGSFGSSSATTFRLQALGEKNMAIM